MMEEVTTTSPVLLRSRCSPFRTRSTLPTPPPDPRYPLSDNCKDESGQITYLPADFRSLINRSHERESLLHNQLQQSLAGDCEKHCHGCTQDSEDKQFTCNCCQEMCAEFNALLKPLQEQFQQSLSAIVCTYSAIEQLNRLYTLWDHYITIDRDLQRKRECMSYLKLLQTKFNDVKDTCHHSDRKVDFPTKKQSLSGLSDAEMLDQSELNLQQSMVLIETALKVKNLSKLQRERSKSVMITAHKADDVYQGFRNSLHTNAGLQEFRRRQSTFNFGKSKVSKWTKVKAAFKWEKVNLSSTPIAIRERFPMPTNNNADLIKHLRVPSFPCGGGSSADSILSSSSGLVLSEAGGTLSSTSSIDDMNKDIVPRRDSSQSDIGQRVVPSISLGKLNPRLVCETSAVLHKPLRISCVMPKHQRSELSMRQDVSMETLLDHTKILPKVRQPPSPLDFNFKHDLNNLEVPSQHLQMNPSDNFPLFYRMPKAYRTAVNSSVPSSPSKYTNFLMGFESEDISSGGDISEPSSLAQELRDRRSSDVQEINQNYHKLRVNLEQEFEEKRREWEKLKLNHHVKISKLAEKSASGSMLTNLTNARSISPNRRASQKLLEENLTPEFKKKLEKWRLMKQSSVHGTTTAGAQQINSMSCGNNSSAFTEIGGSNATGNSGGRIDWNLWKMGQFKLEGQGLSVLPDQKTLSEDFQKKLVQWHKIKQSGVNSKSSKTSHYHLLGKKSETANELKKSESKQMHKEKSERLAKLKAMVDEHPAQRIEVKTADGVLKFEGISRKFTRKLYEWEKARGIEPELSTFALLHPGYCPLDVKHIPNETNDKQGNSPTLNRSLSLSSISASVANSIAPTSITQQPSSLSLNDVNDLKAMAAAATIGTSAEEEEEDIKSSSRLTLLKDQEKAYRSSKNEEPEAVMVEVEDHIEETGSPFITTNLWPTKQMPIYKYEEVKCKDYCSSAKQIQSFETHLNGLTLANVLNSAEKLLKYLKQNSGKSFTATEGSNAVNIYLNCEEILKKICKNYLPYAEDLMKPLILSAISDVQTKLNRIEDLREKTYSKEAEQLTYHQELQGLQDSLEILQQRLLDEQLSNQHIFEFPDVNVPVKERPLSPAAQSSQSQSSEWNDSGLEGAAGGSYPPTSDVAESSTPDETIQQSKTVTVQHTEGASVLNPSGCKKRTRLRKFGSRQSSKTESPSSGDENIANPILSETPRRLRRKNYRSKQRSLEEDTRLWRVSGNRPQLQYPPEITAIDNVSTMTGQKECHMIDVNRKITHSISLPNIAFFNTKQKVMKKDSKIWKSYNSPTGKPNVHLDSTVLKTLSFDQLKEQLTESQALREGEEWSSNRNSVDITIQLERNKKRWKEDNIVEKNLRRSLESDSSDTMVNDTDLRPMTALGVTTDTRSHLRPTTPLTERAWHLQQAKEAFLRGDRYIFPQEERKGEKQSNLSLSSTTGEEECGTVSSPPVPIAPRNQVTRSEHITSKRGFAALASKLKRATRQDTHANYNNRNYDAATNSNSSTPKEIQTALSSLCRHSLLSSNLMTSVQLMPDLSAICKSKSSPHAVLMQQVSDVENGEANADQESPTKQNKLALKRLTTEGSLSKSQSENSFKSPKESRV